jgi:hypothetical protein
VNRHGNTKLNHEGHEGHKGNQNYKLNRQDAERSKITAKNIRTAKTAKKTKNEQCLNFYTNSRYRALICLREYLVKRKMPIYKPTISPTTSR